MPLVTPAGRIISSPRLRTSWQSRPKLADHLQRDRLVVGPAGDEHLPAAVDHATGAERRAHRAMDRAASRRRRPG